jgi:hypothetical protein
MDFAYANYLVSLQIKTHYFIVVLGSAAEIPVLISSWILFISLLSLSLSIMLTQWSCTRWLDTIEPLWCKDGVFEGGMPTLCVCVCFRQILFWMLWKKQTFWKKWNIEQNFCKGVPFRKPVFCIMEVWINWKSTGQLNTGLYVMQHLQNINLSASIH